MEFFEEMVMETAPTRLRLWKRYVDDSFCIHRKGSTEKLLHHLNRFRPIIKFPVEQKEDGTLPFLDTLLRRSENGSLDTLPLGKQSNVVYCIASSCGQLYIGETTRRLEMILKQHRDEMREGDDEEVYCSGACM